MILLWILDLHEYIGIEINMFLIFVMTLVFI